MYVLTLHIELPFVLQDSPMNFRVGCSAVQRFPRILRPGFEFQAGSGRLPTEAGRHPPLFWLDEVFVQPPGQDGLGPRPSRHADKTVHLSGTEVVPFV